MNKQPFIFLSFILLLSGIFTSCQSEQNAPNATQIENLDEKILNANKLIVRDEAKDIELLLKRYAWKMHATGTGLLYFITKEKEGELLKKGDKVDIKYSISLINGKEVYNSTRDGTKTIVIEQSDEPAGLHELLQLMKPNEKARAIIPSHLAYGILGMDNIPPYATLIYRIEILNIHK